MIRRSRRTRRPIATRIVLFSPTPGKARSVGDGPTGEGAVSPSPYKGRRANDARDVQDRSSPLERAARDVDALKGGGAKPRPQPKSDPITKLSGRSRITSFLRLRRRIGAPDQEPGFAPASTRLLIGASMSQTGFSGAERLPSDVRDLLRDAASRLWRVGPLPARAGGPWGSRRELARLQWRYAYARLHPSVERDRVLRTIGSEAVQHGAAYVLGGGSRSSRLLHAWALEMFAHRRRGSH